MEYWKWVKFGVYNRRKNSGLRVDVQQYDKDRRGGVEIMVSWSAIFIIFIPVFLAWIGGEVEEETPKVRKRYKIKRVR